MQKNLATSVHLYMYTSNIQ